MKGLYAATAALLVFAVAAIGCAPHWTDGGWTTVIDGQKGLEHFDRVGDANWRGEHGYIVADQGKGGYLVSKRSYKDFVLYAEFWADHTTNSGLHFRVTEPKKIASATSYEANIFDQAVRPEYSTGSLVGVAMVPPGRYKAGGKWNTFEITAIGPEITVKFNGAVTVYTRDTKFKEGPIALQYGAGAKGTRGGTVRWRKLQIKEL